MPEFLILFDSKCVFFNQRDVLDCDHDVDLIHKKIQTNKQTNIKEENQVTKYKGNSEAINERRRRDRMRHLH